MPDSSSTILIESKTKKCSVSVNRADGSKPTTSYSNPFHRCPFRT